MERVLAGNPLTTVIIDGNRTRDHPRELRHAPAGGSNARIGSMARIDAEQLSDPECVFVAPSLSLARRAEELLTVIGFDYGVEVEQFGTSILFGAPRHAAVFYVGAGQAVYCRSELIRAGLGQGVVGDLP